MSHLDALLDELADRLAARVVSRLREGEPGMIDQKRSPLGAKRHCAAVRRRVGCGEPGAHIVGRRHYLSEQALSEELGRVSSKLASPTDSEASIIRAELDRDLRVLRGGRSSG